ncbi:ribonuclease Oy-like [Ostrea edulis]|uniref:ribonuclease Oy-like n=1 Tax=Ostrea edulis TaxID=37623 RepID=UPI002094741E|nr:ribonuclease Oy-like [Ostrea edulis]
MHAVLLIGLCAAVSAYTEDWDIFTYTQEWPVAVCINGREEHHTCSIPQDVTGWGIHGMWPTKTGTRGPTSCGTQPFDQNAISAILPKLKLLWPNMYSDSSEYSFWEHEWSKHGTCASSLNSTSTEYKYFSKALDLYTRFNGQTLLGKQGIVPSSSATYNIKPTEAALKRELGVNALVQCTYDHDTRRQVIYEIEICLNKSFEPVDCYPDDDNTSGKRSHHHKYTSHPESSCPESYGFHYPPLPGVYTNPNAH